MHGKIVFLILFFASSLDGQVFWGGEGSGAATNGMTTCLSYPYTSTGERSGFSYKGYFSCADNYRYTSSGRGSGFSSDTAFYCDSTEAKYLYYSEVTAGSGFSFSLQTYCLPWAFGGSENSGFSLSGVNYCSPKPYSGPTSGSGFSSSKGECLFPQPVPVTWLDVSAIPMRSVIVLLWRVAEELNCSTYEIRKLLGGDFVPIGLVPCRNIYRDVQQYSFEDSNPLLGPNYYLVRQIDYDGAYSESEVVVAVYEGGVEEEELVVFPNPLRPGELLWLKGMEEGRYTYEIWDMRQGVVSRGEVESVQGEARLRISLLAEGMYVIRLQGSFRQYRAKIFVQNF